MLNSFIEILFNIRFYLCGLFISFFSLVFLWSTIFKYLRLKKYNNVQRIHSDEVPRIGGILIYIFFWIVYLSDFFDDYFLFCILISSLPVVLISLKEDLFHNTTPKNRLVLMMVSCLLFFHLTPTHFPVIEFPILGDFISLYPVNVIFFTFSIIVLMNGMNLIDGANGLMGLSALFQLSTISLLAYNINDIVSFNYAILFLSPLIIFLLFNFPLGKVFIGDLGAYLYGFINGILVIYFFGINGYLLSWLAILILFYPCMELLFSMIRKVNENKNPFDADNNHIHTLIYRKLLNYVNKKIIANNLSTIFLFIFWVLPFSIVILIQNSLYLILATIFFQTFLYLFIYKCFK